MSDKGEAAVPSLVALIGLDDPPRINIVDVGAMIEGEERFACLVESGIGHVTGFEPNPRQMDFLNARGGEQRTYLPHFLGDGGPATFHLTRYQGCASLYKPDVEMLESFDTFSTSRDGGNFAVVHEIPVETVRLDDVPEARPCDYLKVDVQGAELDVLRNAEEFLKDVLIIESEVEFLPLYENQPLFADIDAFLREQGFILHKLVDVSGRALKPFKNHNSPKGPVSQLLWADGVFIRPFLKFKELEAEKLLKLAIILFDVYCSFDMADIALKTHDEKEGSDYFPRYLKGLAAAEKLPKPLFANIRDWD